ncbi:MAG TPA: hypothetical protein VFS52_07835 [Steroidobacteraceae bacterium]|nr:hypothetical protein [Steroidobacteraceae bacterium]
MKDAKLFHLNPHLKDRATYEEFLIRHVAGSTAIETGGSVATIAKDLRRFLDDGMPPLKVYLQKRAK